MKTTTKTTDEATKKGTHIPGKIADNVLYQSMERAERRLADLFHGRILAMILYGPPGIGKSHLVRKVAKDLKKKFILVRPGSNIGFLEILYRYRNRPDVVLVFEDID